MDVAVLARHDQGQVAALGGHSKPLAQRLHQPHAARFVAGMAWPFLVRCRALAQVMRQRGKAHVQCVVLAGGVIHHHHHVHAGIHLRMKLRALRYAVECIDLRQHTRQCTAVAQHVKHLRRPPLHQPA